MTSADASLFQSERTPLLGNDATLESGADSDVANGTGARDSSSPDDSDVPLADELTTKHLLMVLPSVWVGVFLAALGSYAIHSYNPRILFMARLLCLAKYFRA